MTDQAPKPKYISGDSAWVEGLPDGYIITTSLEPAEKLPPYEFLAVGLTGDLDQWDMATFRMVRAGGSNPADTALRSNVFALVGAITVAGGHIEAEMKRVIIRAEEDRGATFVDVDLTWTGLESRLKRIAAGVGPYAAEVSDALEWSRKKQIKKVRDDAVHSVWGLYDLGTVQRSRFRRRTDGEIISGTLDDYASHVPKMWEYVARLARIASWPTGILPPLPDLEPQPELTISLESEG